jgi:hypothetical protein
MNPIKQIGCLTLFTLFVFQSSATASERAIPSDYFDLSPILNGHCDGDLTKFCYELITVTYRSNPKGGLPRPFKYWPQKKLYTLAIFNSVFQGWSRSSLSTDLDKFLGPPPEDPEEKKPFPDTVKFNAYLAEREQVYQICKSRKYDNRACGNEEPSCTAYKNDLPQWSHKSSNEYLCYVEDIAWNCSNSQALKIFKSIPSEILKEIDGYLSCRFFRSNIHSQVMLASLIREARGIHKNRRTATGVFGEYLYGGSGSSSIMFYPSKGLPLLINVTDETLRLLQTQAESLSEIDRVQIHYSYCGKRENGYPVYHADIIE